MIKRILLVNDDGINAEGLAVSERIANLLCDDVWVCAPNVERSGASSCISFSDPIKMEPKGEKRFAINGTPVDCVMIALTHLMADNPPDLIISGVNRGQNIAEDLMYSGTVGAAMQGLVSGYFSIALSQAFGISSAGKIKMNWQTAEHFAPDIIRTLAETHTEGAFNINFPDRGIDEVEGAVFTYQGRREFPLLQMEERLDPHHRPYYWMGFNRHLFVPEKGSDIHTIYGGKISITPLKFNFTDKNRLSTLDKSLNLKIG